MPSPRMTMRRWMLAVAAVATGLALFAAWDRLSRRSARYAALAREHALWEQAAARNRALFEAGIPRRVQEAKWSAAAANDPALRARYGEAVDHRAEQAQEYVQAWRRRERELAAAARYHAALKASCRQAARHPWVLVPPDPPPPE